MSSTNIGYYKLRNRGRGAIQYQLITNRFSQISSLAPQLFFSINCIRNRLLCVSFIELFDFIIYQHLNKRTNILPLATSQIAHLCHQFNLVCPANFLSHVLKALFFNQNSPKMKLFLQKNAKFSSAGGSAPKPPASGGPPKQPPHLEFLATRLIKAN